LVRLHDIGLILFAIENIRPAQRERILQICRAAGVPTVVLPDVLETLRTQIASEQGLTTMNPVGDMAAAEHELDTWLIELDELIAAEAWDTVRERIQARQQQAL
jgi:hypothetical protein